MKNLPAQLRDSLIREMAGHFSNLWGNSDPGLGTAFLRAYLRGVRAYRGGAMPRALSQLAADAAMNPTAVQNACRERLPEDGRVDRATVQKMIDWAVRHGFVNQPMDAADIIDTRFLERVATHTS